jgi:hypothetical protein
MCKQELNAHFSKTDVILNPTAFAYFKTCWNRTYSIRFGFSILFKVIILIPILSAKSDLLSCVLDNLAFTSCSDSDSSFILLFVCFVKEYSAKVTKVRLVVCQTKQIYFTLIWVLPQNWHFSTTAEPLFYPPNAPRR